MGLFFVFGFGLRRSNYIIINSVVQSCLNFFTPKKLIIIILLMLSMNGFLLVLKTFIENPKKKNVVGSTNKKTRMSSDPRRAYKQAFAALRQPYKAVALQKALANITTDTMRQHLLQHLVNCGNENQSAASAAVVVSSAVQSLSFLHEPAAQALRTGQVLLFSAIVANANRIAGLKDVPDSQRAAKLENFYNNLARFAADGRSAASMRAVFQAADQHRTTLDLSQLLLIAMDNSKHPPQIEIIRLLLKKRVCVSRPSKALLPLARAIHNSNADVVRLLLQHGADPIVHHSWNKRGSGFVLTALELAARSLRGASRWHSRRQPNPTVEVVRELVRFGGSPLVDASDFGAVRAVLNRLLPLRRCRSAELASACAAGLRIMLASSGRARGWFMTQQVVNFRRSARPALPHQQCVSDAGTCVGDGFFHYSDIVRDLTWARRRAESLARSCRREHARRFWRHYERAVPEPFTGSCGSLDQFFAVYPGLVRSVGRKLLRYYQPVGPAERNAIVSARLLRAF